MLIGRFADSGAKIAGNADLNRNLAVSQFLDQVGILPCVKAVSNALGVEVERPPDGFRGSGFSCMGREMETMILRIRVGTAE